MVMTRGSGSGTVGLERLGMSDDEIQNMISTQLTIVVKEAILEISRSIKTILINMFASAMALSLML